MCGIILFCKKNTKIVGATLCGRPQKTKQERKKTIMKPKRITAVLLSVAMSVSLLLAFSLTASAADETTQATDKNITLGTSALKGAQKSSVWFGNYQQSEYTPKTTPESPSNDTVYTDSDGTKFVYLSKTQKYYKVEPIKWRVLDADNDYDRNATVGTTDTTRSLFLLSDQNLDVFNYYTSPRAVVWKESTMRQCLNANDNFIGNAFSFAEKNAIVKTKVINNTYDGRGNPNPSYDTPGGDDTEDQIFLLSIAEVNNTNYGFTDSNERKSTNTAYVAGGGKINSGNMEGSGVADSWWLRSPGNDAYDAVYVSIYGNVDLKGIIVNIDSNAVRPAFNLDLASVLFTSSPTGKKTDKMGMVSAVDSYSQSDYKLTVKDSGRAFDIVQKEIDVTKDGPVAIEYTGATVGENEYISAMITDKDGKDVLYYGQLANITKESQMSGTVNLTIPDDIAFGEYKIKLFNEQINGEYKTDFSSKFVDIPLNIDSECEGTKYNPYRINSLTDLEAFRDAVNSGTTYEGKYIKLMDNIDLSTKYNATTGTSWTPIGNRADDKSLAKKFSGTFDGNGKKISGLYVDAAVSVQGLFGCVASGTVKNLTVSGTVKSSNSIVGGIVGFLKDGNIENCINECNITGSGDGNGSFGGIVGQTNGTNSVKLCENKGNIAADSSVGGIAGYSSNKTVVQNSYNTGDVTATSRNAGGIIGAQGKKTETDAAKVENCHSVGKIGAPLYVGAIVGTDEATVTNSYYIENCNAEGTTFTNTAGTSKSAEVFASGEVALALQNGQTDKNVQVWGQKLTDEKDRYPVLTGDTSKKIYVVHIDCGKKNTGYSNTNADINTSHNYQNGICTAVANDPHYQPAELKDGVYEISNAGQLNWFAKLVNGTAEGEAQNQSANAKLTADIDMSAVTDYVPIGGAPGLYYSKEDTDKGYSGVFDGNGHKIKNLSIKGSNTAELTYGVIGTLCGEVKNLGVEYFSFEAGNKDCRAGGIVGQILSGGKVSDCYAVNSTITATSKVAGGIAGCNYSGSILNCFTCRVAVTASRGGGIAGDNRGDVDENDRKGTIKNCYTDCGNINYNQNNGNTEGCETDLWIYDFSSGRIAYALNNNSSDGVWKQNLDENRDIYPNFAGATVYRTEGCVTYTNTQPNGEKAHNRIDGVCSDCGDYGDEQAELKDGVYEISNAGQLLWFADKVNGGDYAIDGKLVNDIDVSAAKRIGIGADANRAYKGVFDGNGKTISNLSVTASDRNGVLFGVVDGGTVKNFTVKGEIVISAPGSANELMNVENIGGAVGSAKGKATIENIISYVNINDNGRIANHQNRWIGGIVGALDNSTVKNCSYYGTVEMQIARVTAGIVGSAVSSSTVTDCTNYGNVKVVGDAHHIGGIVGGGQTGTLVAKCINNGDVTSGGTDCIGGIVAYANQNVRIENCGNTGKVTCTADGNGFVGGVLGYINHKDFKGIENCYNYGSIVTNEGRAAHAGAIIGRKKNCNESTISVNNFYLKDSCANISDSTATAAAATVKEKISFENGEVAYRLGSAWGQKIGTDKLPVPGGKKVYQYGVMYSNDEPNIFRIWDVSTSGNSTTVTVSIPTAGDYTIVLADYEGGRMNGVKTVPVTTTQANEIVTKPAEISLGTGDKVMLLDNFSNFTPMCGCYDVK